MLKAPQGFSLIMSVGMATLILLLGAVLMFTELYGDIIHGSKRMWLAILFFVYAGYRYMRAWQLFKSQKRADQRKQWENRQHRSN